MTKSVAHYRRALRVSEQSVRQISDRIVATYGQASDSDKIEGAAWYSHANAIAFGYSEKTGYNIETVATVISHLSPRQRWAYNIEAAWLVLNGEVPERIFPDCVARCIKAIDSDKPLSTINGNKTKAFAVNILGNYRAVTIDTWIMSAVFPNTDKTTLENWLKRKDFYDALAHCFRLAAKRIGIAPAICQATVWCHIRGSAE